MVVPRGNPRKLAAILLPLAVLAAGCGGGGSSRKQVALKVAEGPGIHASFTTLASWRVGHALRQLDATDGKGLVWVRVYPLPRPYRPELFERAVPQLDAAVQKIAREEGARVTSSKTTTLIGRKARAYTLERSDGPRERIGFVLIGRRELELYCRLAGPDAAQACDLLFGSLKAGP